MATNMELSKLGSQCTYVCLISVCEPNPTSSHTRLASRIEKLHCLTSVCQPNPTSSHTRLASRIVNLIIKIIENQAMIRRVKGVGLHEHVIAKINKETSTSNKHGTVKAW